MHVLRGTAATGILTLLLSGCGSGDPVRLDGTDPIASPSSTASAGAMVQSAQIDQARRSIGFDAVSADGRLVARFAKGSVTISTKDGQVVTSFDTGSGWAHPPMDFAPDGNLFAVSAPGKVIIYEVATKRLRDQATNEKGTLRFSPNGRFLAGQNAHPDQRLTSLSVGGDSIHRSPALPSAEKPGDGNVLWAASEVAVSDDGKKVVGVGQDGFLVWNVGEPAVQRVPCGCALFAGTVDRAGGHAAYLLDDGGVSVWSVGERRELWHSRPAQGDFSGGSLRFTEDGRFLLVVGRDKAERVWTVSGGEVVTG